MEMTCHRRDLNLNSFITEMKPSAFSASSSCWISSISASTSSHPRSLCSAKGGGQGGPEAGPPLPRSRDAALLALSLLPQDSLTFPGSWLVFLPNQQVPGALGEEGQQQELHDSWDPGHGEEDGPAFEEASVSREGGCDAACHRAPHPALIRAAAQALRGQGLGLSHSPHPQPLGWCLTQTLTEWTATQSQCPPTRWTNEKLTLPSAGEKVGKWEVSTLSLCGHMASSEDSLAGAGGAGHPPRSDPAVLLRHVPGPPGRPD